MAFCKRANDVAKSLNIALFFYLFLNDNSQTLRLLKDTQPQVFAPNVIPQDRFSKALVHFHLVHVNTK